MLLLVKGGWFVEKSKRCTSMGSWFVVKSKRCRSRDAVRCKGQNPQRGGAFWWGNDAASIESDRFDVWGEPGGGLGGPQGGFLGGCDPHPPGVWPKLLPRQLETIVLMFGGFSRIHRPLRLPETLIHNVNPKNPVLPPPPERTTIEDPVRGTAATPFWG